MSFDDEAYAREVLEPARLGGNQPPADLLVRYALSLPLDPAQIAATLPALLGCWRRVRRELKYRKLVTRLEADHARLAPAFERAKAGDLAALQAAIGEAGAADDARWQLLGREIGDIAGPVKRITAELAAELATRHGVRPPQVASQLDRAGVTVAAPDPLPATPPVTGYPRYREALRTLGCRHTADFLRHGSGPVAVWDPALGSDDVAAADRKWAAKPHDGSRTLASTVLVGLKALAGSRGTAGLAELVRYEVAEELRTRHRQGASAAALVEYAEHSLGLATDDARRIAFAVRAEPLGAVPAAAPVTAAPPTAAAPREPSRGTPLSAIPPLVTPANGGPLSTAPPNTAPPGTAASGAPANQPATADPAAPQAGTAAHGAADRVQAGGQSAPLGAYAPLPAPSHLAADRAGDEVVVRWQWPTELTEVAVRWRSGDHDWRERSISRGAYRSQGGAWLPLGEVASNGGRNAPLRIELVPVAPRHGRRVTGAPVTVEVPGRVEAWYEVTRSGPPWRRELTVAVRAGQNAQLRRLMVVLRRGTVMPLHAADGEVLRQLDDVRLAPGEPLRLRLPAPRGPYWLRCFAADDEVELRDPPVVQLRGR